MSFPLGDKLLLPNLLNFSNFPVRGFPNAENMEVTIIASGRLYEYLYHMYYLRDRESFVLNFEKAR